MQATFTGNERATSQRSTALFTFTFDGKMHQLCNAAVVQYHATDVFAIAGYPNDTSHGPSRGCNIVLQSGGYVTATTARRMNQALTLYGIPATVHRHKGTFLIRDDHGEPILQFTNIAWLRYNDATGTVYPVD